LVTLSQLDENSVSSKEDIAELKTKLNEVCTEIKNHGVSEKKGLDTEWRAAFVSLQGIIEKALTQSFLHKQVEKIEGFVITPRMPTPLMLSNGKTFKELNTKNANDFAELRLLILKDYLEAGGLLNAVYSNSAVAALQNQNSAGVAVYNSFLGKYNTLKDHPVIKMEMENFPTDKTGAMYYINNDPEQAITVQSYQLSQLDKTIKQSSTWAIKMGGPAKERVVEINNFLAENGATNLIR